MRADLALHVLEVAAHSTRGDDATRKSRRLPVTILLVAVLYFAWVTLVATRVVITGLEPGIKIEDWVAFGALLMGVLLVILLIDMLTTRREEAGAGSAGPPLPPAALAPARAPEDELVVTAEEWQGRRVLEYSRPPKSRHGSSVYAKVLVPLDGALVLRVEDLIAEARDSP